jgi:hypothetical protein
MVFFFEITDKRFFPTLMSRMMFSLQPQKKTTTTKHQPHDDEINTLDHESVARGKEKNGE